MRRYFILCLLAFSLGWPLETALAQPLTEEVLSEIRAAAKDESSQARALELTQPYVDKTPEQWAAANLSADDTQRLHYIWRARVTALAGLGRTEDALKAVETLWPDAIDRREVAVMSVVLSSDPARTDLSPYIAYQEASFARGASPPHLQLTWYMKVRPRLTDVQKRDAYVHKFFEVYGGSPGALDATNYGESWVRVAFDTGIDPAETLPYFRNYLRNRTSPHISPEWLKRVIPAASPLTILAFEKPDDLLANLADREGGNPLALMRFRRQLVDGGDQRLLAATDAEKALVVDLPDDGLNSRWTRAMFEGRFQDAALIALRHMIANVTTPSVYTAAATQMLVPAVRCGSQSYNEPVNTVLQALGGENEAGEAVEPDYDKIEKIINALSNE